MADIPKEGRVFYRMVMTLGERIRAAREELGLDQLELANKLGVEPPTVSRWENNVIRPRAKRLKAIADMLGRPVSWFQYGDVEGLAAMERRLKAIEERTLKSPRIEYKAAIPDEVIRNWNSAGPTIQLICLYFLTGENRYKQSLGQKILTGLEALSRSLGPKRAPSKQAR